MPTTPKERGPGRPRLPLQQRKANILAVRVRPPLRDALTAAAAAAGRSLSEEIELRLNQSEDRPAIIRELALLLKSEAGL